MKFADYYISEELKKNLSKLGFVKPTDIQFKSIPPILKGEDVLAIAQTGTGKTAAFAIPVIDILHKKRIRQRAEGIRCLVMVPTRELAQQITEVFEKLSRHTKVKVYGIYGGVEQEQQIAKLNDGFDILVATPGRMFDLISQGFLRVERIEILILDEADHMLDLGFIKDIQDIKKKLKQQHQTLFFSATINDYIKKLAYSLVRNAIRIQVSPKDPVSKNVDHSVAFIEMDDKRFFLERFINENPGSKILVFVRTKIRAERVRAAMERVGIETLTIHGDKEQQDRFGVMNRFKKGEVKILIATDVSSRGIDIPNVDFVVNYDLPDKPENYVHRVGRTGRGREKGLAISFCSKDEKPILTEIQEFLGSPIAIVEMNRTDYKEILEQAKEKEGETDWKSVIHEIEAVEEWQKKKGKKPKR